MDLIVSNSVKDVLSLMTPREVLELDNLVAKPILKEIFYSFDTIIARRTSIRHLELLPVKTDEMRALYNALDKSELVSDLKKKLRGKSIICEKNLYPYDLPSDLEQYIAWVEDRETKMEDIAEFIANLNLNLSDTILFERPLTKTKLVKGTFPQIRHIHLWVKKNA